MSVAAMSNRGGLPNPTLPRLPRQQPPPPPHPPQSQTQPQPGGHPSSDDASVAARRLAREERRRQKRIVVFCNGDIFFKGKKVSITPNRYLSYNDLLQDLTARMPQHLHLPNGVRQLFSPTTGRRLADVMELRDGGAYVCAGNETFKPVSYGVSENTPWAKGRRDSQTSNGQQQQHHQQARQPLPHLAQQSQQASTSSSLFAGYNAFPPSRYLKHQRTRQPLSPVAGQQQQRMRQRQRASQQRQQQQQATATAPVADRPLRAAGAAAPGEPAARQPRLVTVVKEGPRPRQVVKMLLNRRGIQSFAQLLVDISDSFGGSRGRRERLKKIYTIAGREVHDIGDLFRDDDLFVGCVEDSLGLEQVEDLLEELYPGNPGIRKLLSDWERRLKRRQQRQEQLQLQHRPNQPRQQLQAPHHRISTTDERDSGYDESEQQALASSRDQPVSELVHPPHSQTRAKQAAIKKPLPLLRDADDSEAAEAAALAEALAEAERRARERQEAAEAAAGKQKLPTAHSVLPPIRPRAEAALEAAENNASVPNATGTPDSTKPLEPVLLPRVSLASNLEGVKKDAAAAAKLEEAQRSLSPVHEEEAAATSSQPAPDAGDQPAETDGAPAEAERPPRPPLIRPISSTRYVLERYDLGRAMGDGNFAVVRACVKRDTGKEFAVKVIDKRKLRGKEHMVINEVRIMRLCQHPNIVRLLEEYETKTEIYLIMELVKGGDLFDAISQVVKFNEIQAASMVADVAGALHYLHSRSIVHRDLKPENLLVYRSKDNKISLKLGDFGLAMEVDEPIYTVCGTPTYVAPEILEETGYGLEVDLWALGVIAYILMCGFPPFRSRDRVQSELFQLIRVGRFEFLSPYWDHVSTPAKDLIDHLLVVDRAARYSAIDVLCHPWVISIGGSKRIAQEASLKDEQQKIRDGLIKEAATAMKEFKLLKATSVYGGIQ